MVCHIIIGLSKFDTCLFRRWQLSFPGWSALCHLFVIPVRQLAYRTGSNRF